MEKEPTVDVLDKIREEIADLDDAEYEFEGYYKAVNDAVQIIDKYRGGQMIDIESICEKCGKKDGCQEYEQVRKAKELYLVKGCEWFIKKENRNERT